MTNKRTGNDNKRTGYDNESICECLYECTHLKQKFMSKKERNFSPIDFKDRFPALDGIRAVAVTLVFMEHFGGGAHGGRVLNLINDIRVRGWVGVDLFFVLSGFLITGILFDKRNDSHYFKRFFARRSLRIFPVFYLVVAVLLALTPILHYQWRAGHLLFLIYMGNFFGNDDFGLYTVFSANHPTLKVRSGTSGRCAWKSSFTCCGLRWCGWSAVASNCFGLLRVFRCWHWFCAASCW
jgi:hypothetical protein